MEIFVNQKRKFSTQKKWYRERAFGWLIGIYFLILFGMHFARIFNNNFWFDEVFTINLARMPFWEMIKATAADVHPPFYYIVVWGLYRVMGDCNGVTYHLSSLLAYGFLLLFVFFYVRKSLGKIVSVIFVTLVSFLYSSCVYITEARMYFWAAFFLLMSYVFLFQIMREGRRRDWVYFVLASLGAAYTHYYALISVAFLYVFLFVYIFCKGSKQDRKRVCITYLVTILAYLPWFIVLLQTMARITENYWINDTPGVKDCFLYLFDSGKNELFFITALALLFVATLLETRFVNISLSQEEDIRIDIRFSGLRFTKLFLWMLAGIFSIIGTILVGKGVSAIIRPVFILRYLFPVSMLAWLIFAVCVPRLKGRTMCAAVCMACLLCLIGPTYKMFYDYEKNEAELSENIYELPIEKDAVILMRMMDGTVARYYYPEAEIITEESSVALVDFVRNSKESDIWFMSKERMTTEEADSISSIGYSVTGETEGVIGNAHTYVYHLVKD